jgi:mercuric ion transport protein
MDNSLKIIPCNCQNQTPEKKAEESSSKVKKTIKALPSIFTSLLIAFFPKCPFCWAIYMSMLGTLGIAKLPYMPWLLPVLLLFLGLHLFIIYKKSKQKGYLPLLLSLTGSIVLIAERSFFQSEQWLLIIGMLMIISGSLLNSFLKTRLFLILS